MVIPAVGAVVLVQFPFSDLTDVKLRPAVVLADPGRGDWVLIQITSKPYGDTRAVELNAEDFATGGLRVASFARPGKLFCANQRIITALLGQLGPESTRRIVQAVVSLLNDEVP